VNTALRQVILRNLHKCNGCRELRKWN